MARLESNNNPWKGLNFYMEGEVLYGRDNEIESLSQYIINNTQTVLYGKSGIGKSSILNAGIFPIARRHGLFPVPIRLDHGKNDSYIAQIRAAILKSGAEIHEILPPISEEHESLWEFFHRNIFFDKDGNRAQLLIVLDQFEEFFTLQQVEKTKRAFFDELADLINDITPLYVVNAKKTQTAPTTHDAQEVSGDLDSLDIEIDLGETEDAENTRSYITKTDHHFVFTLREDFLSYLERYTAYIPEMKSNRYPLLPINEEQAADIIMKPQSGLIEKSVADLIIQKVTGKGDFTLDGIPEIEVDAAVLSLYLSRLYIKKGDQKTITAELVNQFSDDIIKDFYEESVADLPPTDIEEIEDQLLTYDGRRNNVSRNDLVREGVAESTLKTLVEDRKLLRQFSYQDDIRVEFMHDILCPIVDERIDKREAAKRQAEEQKAQEEKQRKLLEEEQRKRDAIEAKAKAERERLEEEARLQRKKNRIRLSIAVGLLLIAGLSWLLWFLAERKDFRNYYASYTTKNGWPVGIGKKLGPADREYMPVYYELVRIGYNKKPTRVYVLNWDKELTTNTFDESPLVALHEADGSDNFARRFALMQQQTAYWIFTPDNEGNISRKTAYDIHGKELYAIQYFRSEQGLWANFIDKNGQSLPVRDNGADRVRISVENGYYTGYTFFNESRVPVANGKGAYGYHYELDEEGRVLVEQPLDIFGDMAGQAITYEDFDAYGRWTKSNVGRAEWSRHLVVNEIGGVIDSMKFNDKGNVIRRLPLGYGVIEIPSHLPDKEMPYRVERRTLEQGRYTVAYFAGNSPDDINVPVTITTDNVGTYHMMVVDTTFEDGLKKVITEYFDTNRQLVQSGINRDVAYYDEKGEMPKHLTYKGDKILYAYLNEYKEGIIVAQSVMGIDGTAIRCPDWDQFHICYYKMKLVQDVYGNMVAISGVNEFGEESLITYGDYVYDITLVPSENMDIRESDTSFLYGRQTHRESIRPLGTKNKVNYIHILDRAGTWYQAGVRDGDLWVSEQDGTLTVARPNIEKDTYDILKFHPQSGETGADKPYTVYFTQKEMERYNNAIKR